MTVTSQSLYVGNFVPASLRHHVLGVPVGPVGVALPGALLVLAVGGLRTLKHARQIACGGRKIANALISEYHL